MKIIHHRYVIPETFDEKLARTIVKHISMQRLNDELSFEGYGIISFDAEDTKCLFPHVDISKDFSHFTNAICFDIKDSYRTNKHEFNKCIIFQTGIRSRNESFGYILYNTKTERIIQNPWLEYDIDKLFSRLNNQFNQFISKVYLNYIYNK